jgi:hypothetical protein
MIFLKSIIKSKEESQDLHPKTDRSTRLTLLKYQRTAKLLQNNSNQSRKRANNSSK